MKGCDLCHDYLSRIMQTWLVLYGSQALPKTQIDIIWEDIGTLCAENQRKHLWVTREYSKGISMRGFHAYNEVQFTGLATCMSNVICTLNNSIGD